MKSMSVELRFSPEAIGPIHAGICRSPDLDREVILGGQSVDGVETITSFVYGDPEAYEPLLADRPDVREYDVTPAEGGFFVYLRRELGERGDSLLDALAQETVVVVPPIEVRSDRTMGLTLVGHPADLRSVIETVPDAVETVVHRISDGATVADAPLSDRQREALGAAWNLGYYDVPRENGIEAVADDLDCAVSTASELLRRGQARLVARALETEPF